MTIYYSDTDIVKGAFAGEADVCAGCWIAISRKWACEGVECEGCAKCPPVPSHYLKGDSGIDSYLEEFKVESKAVYDRLERAGYLKQGYSEELADGLLSGEFSHDCVYDAKGDCKACGDFEKRFDGELKRDPVEAAESKAKQSPFVDSPLIPELVKRGWTENQALGLIAKVADNPEIADRFPEFFKRAYTDYVQDVAFKGDKDKQASLLNRSDGATLLYQGKMNCLFGEPSTGKSWIALMAAYEVVLMGGKVLWWDFEDSPDTMARRAESLGALEHIQDKDNFKWAGYSLADVTPEAGKARQELEAWLTSSDVSLVVLDAAESAGCPSDGADVAPWFAFHITPWIRAGCSVIWLDHVPKQREGRPAGPIGSNHKLAKVDGAALYVTGVPWSKVDGGGIKLVNHKDRHGELPAVRFKQVALVTGEHKGGKLEYRLDPPAKDADADADPINEVMERMLYAIVEAGFDGIATQKAVRATAKARYQIADLALDQLIDDGLVERIKGEGKGYKYVSTEAGKAAMRDA